MNPEMKGTHLANVVVTLAPDAQSMDRLGLTATKGVMVYQQTQGAEALAQYMGIPYEAANKYKVARISDELFTKGKRFQPTGEELEKAPMDIFVEEESSDGMRICLTCCGCGNLRGLKLHFYGNGGEQYVMQRKFRLGAWICCNLNSTLFRVENGSSTQQIGRVRENCSPYPCKCIEMCCLCTTYDDIQEYVNGKYEQRYRVRENQACCNGSHNNCCGGTCINNDMVFDVLDKEHKVVAQISKTFGGGNGISGCCAALCRYAFKFSSFVVTFPDNTTEDQRALILAAVHHIDYKLFEKSGNENN